MNDQDVTAILDQTDRVFRQAVDQLVTTCRLGPGLRPAEQAERRRLKKEIAEFERKHPKLAVRENARLAREDAAIRRRVFARGLLPAVGIKPTTDEKTKP